MHPAEAASPDSNTLGGSMTHNIPTYPDTEGADELYEGMEKYGVERKKAPVWSEGH